MRNMEATKISYSPLIGKDYPCFIVAEAGINHSGELKFAQYLAQAAKDANADAVKFQTYLQSEVTNPNISYPETLQL